MLVAIQNLLVFGAWKTATKTVTRKGEEEQENYPAFECRYNVRYSKDDWIELSKPLAESLFGGYKAVEPMRVLPIGKYPGGKKAIEQQFKANIAYWSAQSRQSYNWVLDLGQKDGKGNDTKTTVTAAHIVEVLKWLQGQKAKITHCPISGNRRTLSMLLVLAAQLVIHGEIKGYPDIPVVVSDAKSPDELAEQAMFDNARDGSKEPSDASRLIFAIDQFIRQPTINGAQMTRLCGKGHGFGNKALYWAKVAAKHPALKIREKLVSGEIPSGKLDTAFGSMLVGNAVPQAAKDAGFEKCKGMADKETCQKALDFLLGAEKSVKTRALSKDKLEAYRDVACYAEYDLFDGIDPDEQGEFTLATVFNAIANGDESFFIRLGEKLRAAGYGVEQEEEGDKKPKPKK